jgi:hypothetical protein
MHCYICPTCEVRHWQYLLYDGYFFWLWQENFCSLESSGPALWLAQVAIQCVQCKVDHSPPCSAETKNEWGQLHICPYGVDRDNLTLHYLPIFLVFISLQAVTALQSCLKVCLLIVEQGKIQPEEPSLQNIYTSVPK